MYLSKHQPHGARHRKVKFIEIADASGSIGGTVTARNRGGLYQRKRVKPTNPQSSYQVSARNRLGTNSQAWRSLTAAQRSAWSALANTLPVRNTLGEPILLAGNQLYNRFNNNLGSVGVSAISDAPTPAAVGSVTAGTLTSTAGTPALSLTLSNTVPAGTKVQVWLTPPLSPGIANVNKYYRLCGSLAAAATSPANLYSLFTGRYGAILVAGQKIFVRIVPINTTTGQAGLPTSASAIIGA